METAFSNVGVSAAAHPVQQASAKRAPRRSCNVGSGICPVNRRSTILHPPFPKCPLGHDFSRVRVHTDRKAAKSARVVKAQAYGAGHNIVFAADKYHPETSIGDELLGRELTHTIQQGASEGRIDSTQLSRPEDPAEQKADMAAALVARGQTVGAITGQGIQVARQDANEKPPDSGANATGTVTVDQ